MLFHIRCFGITTSIYTSFSSLNVAPAIKPRTGKESSALCSLCRDRADLQPLSRMLKYAGECVCV